MRYAKILNEQEIEELNPLYIKHEGMVYTNPLNNPNVDLSELGYKELVVDNFPTYDTENEKVVMFYQDKGNAIHRSWRVEQLTEEEIADVLKADDEIDHGAKLFELPKELQQGAKKARATGNRKPTTTKRERAPDTAKRELIALIAETVENVTDNGMVDIANPEREMTFTKNGKKYKIVLSAPRS